MFNLTAEKETIYLRVLHVSFFFMLFFHGEKNTAAVLSKATSVVFLNDDCILHL